MAFKKGTLLFSPGTIVNQKTDYDIFGISKNYALLINEFSSPLLSIRKSCDANCVLVFKIWKKN